MSEEDWPLAGGYRKGHDGAGSPAWALGLPEIPVLPNLNRRTHWSVQAREKAQLREMACWLARSAKVPAMEHITVGLIHIPRIERRRDPDNIVPVLKALVDGLVDAGVVSDDTAAFVTRTFPDIRPAQKIVPHARLVLTVHEGRP